MLSHLHCEALDMGVVPDVPAALESAFATAAANADVVITSGGVSVGEADYVKQLLDKMGEVLFWKIAMKPGRPLAYGRIGSAHFFGLPGNPVAVMVTFYQFVREALLVLQGRTEIEAGRHSRQRWPHRSRRWPAARSSSAASLRAGRVGGKCGRPANRGSGILSSMSQANCFIVLPTDTANVPAGEVVDVQLLEGLI
jgi:molybdopterin molybdotransferase